MPADLSILIFIDLMPETLGILVSSTGIESWTIPNSRTITQEVVSMLQNIGVPVNRARTRISMAKDWPASARKLRQRLIPPEQFEAIGGRGRVVVVPDGVLWYVPFELLLNEEPTKPGRGLSISYSPTPGFAASNAKIRQSSFGHDVALVAGKLLGPNNETLEDELFRQIGDALGDQTQMPVRNDAVEYRLTNLAKNIVVVDFIRSMAGQRMSLGLINKGPPDPLSDWMRLPRRVPQSIFLPGFQSGAVGTPIGDGRDLFFTIAALRCSGIERIWISRWCVGGESTALMMSELLQELPYDEMGPAFKRATQTLRRQRLNPATEPLLTGIDARQDDVGGDHPLFWSGYLLSAPVQSIDSPSAPLR